MDKHIFQWFRWWKGDKVDGATQKKCWKYQNRIPTYYGHNYKVEKEALSTTYTRCCSRSGRIIFGNYDNWYLHQSINLLQLLTIQKTLLMHKNINKVPNIWYNALLHVNSSITSHLKIFWIFYLAAITNNFSHLSLVDNEQTYF